MRYAIEVPARWRSRWGQGGAGASLPNADAAPRVLAILHSHLLQLPHPANLGMVGYGDGECMSETGVT